MYGTQRSYDINIFGSCMLNKSWNKLSKTTYLKFSLSLYEAFEVNQLELFWACLLIWNHSCRLSHIPLQNREVPFNCFRICRWNIGDYPEVFRQKKNDEIAMVQRAVRYLFGVDVDPATRMKRSAFRLKRNRSFRLRRGKSSVFRL